ncbi:hypothetical protein [Sphingomonas faeni]|uniref:hypothetical protein n=1 Tax=Sphingomonas faeni TaxID=185950 RepID=UPI003357C6B5
MHRCFVVLLCAATLMLKLLVPTGYMVGSHHGRVTIELCPGVAAQPMAMATDMAMSGAMSGARSMAMPGAMTSEAMSEAMAMPGMHGDVADHGKSQDHGKRDMPCAFSGLSAASLGAVDPVLLVALITSVMALGLLPVMLPTFTRRSHLRPPLRGPPGFL